MHKETKAAPTQDAKRAKKSRKKQRTRPHEIQKGKKTKRNRRQRPHKLKKAKQKRKTTKGRAHKRKEEEEEAEDEETEGDGAPAAKRPATSKNTATSKTPDAAMKRPAASKVKIAEAKAVIIAFAKHKRAAKESNPHGAFTTKAYTKRLSLSKDKDEAKAAHKIAAVTWNAACA